MEKKKVCILTEYLAGGGVPKAVVDLANELAQRGYVVHLFSFSLDVQFDLNKDNIHLFKIKAKRIIPVRPLKELLRRLHLPNTFGLLAKPFTVPGAFLVFLLENSRFSYRLLHRRRINALKELIQQNGPYAAFFSHLPALNFLTIACQPPNYYCVIHGDIKGRAEFIWRRSWRHTGASKRLRNFLRRRQAINFYSGQNIVTVGEELLERTLEYGIKPRSIQHIYNIFDFAKLRKRAQAYEPAQSDYIVYVGRLTKDKDPVTLLNAYAKSGIKQKLVMIGAGDHEQTIKNLAQQLGIADKLVLPGYLANPYPYVKNAKALVLTSRVEGVPLVLVEALILGTPVVSTACYTGPKEVLTDELAEFLSPVGDVDAFARKLVKVIARPPKIQDKHINKFALEKNIAKYISLIEKA